MQQTAIPTTGPYRAPRKTERKLTGLGVLAIMLGSFAVVAGVNALMVYDAVSTFSGEVDPKPYEHGLAYNRDIAAAEAQAARHWKVAAHVSGKGMTKAVEAIFHDSDATALTGLIVTAGLEFATDMTRDRHVTLTEAAPGVYRGTVNAASGQFDLVIEAKRDAKPLFQSRNRIMIP